MLVYLNDDFEGGQTTFLEEQPDAFRTNLAPSKNPVSAVIDKRVRARVQPRTGSVLLFNHDVLHEGTAVGAPGKKYLLRAEVMFSRVDMLSARHKRGACEFSADYQNCRRLYKEAAMHESKGDASTFCTTYLQALKLQFKASRSIAAQFHKNRCIRAVLSPYGQGVLYWPSLNVLTRMLSFLPPASLCAVMATGQQGCAAARLRDVWFGIVVHSFPFGPQELRVLQDSRLTHDWLGFYKVVHLACRIQATANQISIRQQEITGIQLRLLQQEALEFTHENTPGAWQKGVSSHTCLAFRSSKLPMSTQPSTDTQLSTITTFPHPPVALCVTQARFGMSGHMYCPPPADCRVGIGDHIWTMGNTACTRCGLLSPTWDKGSLILNKNFT